VRPAKYGLPPGLSSEGNTRRKASLD
jgi:hypothetical protein